MKWMFLLALLGLQQLAWSQIAEKAELTKPIAVGSTLPDVDFVSASGQERSVLDQVEDNRTILIIYRGGWCPYCNLHLSEVGQIEEDLVAMGYEIIAVSPDTPEKIESTSEDKGLNYKLFSDTKGNLIKGLGLAFKPDQETRNFIKKTTGAESTGFLPVPALLIIDEAGKILFFHSNPDFKQRLRKDELLKKAKEFAKEED